MMDQEKPKIEVTEDPEYSDLLIDDIMFHGNQIRNPKEWYPELLYNSKLEQGARIYTNKNNVKAIFSARLRASTRGQRNPI